VYNYNVEYLVFGVESARQFADDVQITLAWRRASASRGKARKVHCFGYSTLMGAWAVCAHNNMDSPHPDERPAKKRRFFAENSSPAQVRSKHRSSPPLSPPQAPSSLVNVKGEDELGNDIAALDGFDVGMLQAVVGELPYSTLQKLKDVSSSNVERGDYH
jgi:hypothetical protein